MLEKSVNNIWIYNVLVATSVNTLLNLIHFFVCSFLYIWGTGYLLIRLYNICYTVLSIKLCELMEPRRKS